MRNVNACDMNRGAYPGWSSTNRFGQKAVSCRGVTVVDHETSYRPYRNPVKSQESRALIDIDILRVIE